MSNEYALILARRGFRVVSRKYGILSRVDRPDWVSVIAYHMFKSPAEFYVLDKPNTVGSTWADHYRRCYSKDKFEVSPDVARLIPTSTHDTIGFINDDGDEILQTGTVCERHGYYPDAMRCPQCIAPDMLLKVLGPLMDDIRAAAEFDKQWEDVEQAYDLLVRKMSRQHQPSTLEHTHTPRLQAPSLIDSLDYGAFGGELDEYSLGARG
jgi:hypothetical protein